MVSFKQEIQSAGNKTDAEILAAVLQPLVDQVVASTLEKSGKTGDRSNEVRAQQLRLRGFEMADVADYGLLQQKKTELREAIAAAGGDVLDVWIEIRQPDQIHNG